MARAHERGSALVVLAAAFIVAWALTLPSPAQAQSIPGFPDWFTNYTCKTDGSLPLYPFQFCNGFNDCPDGSDEAPATCNATTIQPICTANYKGVCPFDSNTTAFRCVDSFRLCDGISDCPGGSDESPELCKTLDCSLSFRVQCPSYPNQTEYMCIAPSSLCDGTSNCPGGADESLDYCKSYDCSSTFRYKCPEYNGTVQCTYAGSSLCDGIPDPTVCPGGMDESPELCATFDCSKTSSSFGPRVNCPGFNGTYQCASDAKTLCDNSPGDCPGGLDESRKFCKKIKCSDTGRVQCPSGIGCVNFKTQFCDGDKDCADGSDERRRLCISAKFCNSTGRGRCPSGVGCVSLGQRCDGVRDCADGSDEWMSRCATFNCSSQGKVQCPGKGVGQCILPGRLCDGKEDCRYASDEDPEFCSTFDCASINKTACPTPRPFRPTVRKCVYPSQLCNGNSDCSWGSDEARGFCKSWGCAPGYIKCGKGSLRCRPGFYCDGNFDCPRASETAVSSDESPGFCKKYKCPAGLVKCKDKKQCIPATRVCDGLNFNGASQTDCADESDEDPTFCAAYNCTSTGRIPCPSGAGYCLPDTCAINSGTDDSPAPIACPDGSDQNSTYAGLRGADCKAPVATS